MRKFLLPFFLGLIVIFGFFIRTVRLADVPLGFFCDEASIGYNAYTLLTKGTDEYGIAFPTFFKAFGEYKSPVQIYSTVPFVALFGLNEFSVRFTSVFYGALSLLAIYLLVLELFKNRKEKRVLALLSALLLAITPWHIHFSRIAFELMPFVFFTTLGLYLFLKAQEKSWFLPLSVMAFSLALYSYFAGRIFIPLLGLGIIITYLPYFFKHIRMTIFCLVLLVIFLSSFMINLFSPEGQARWKQASIFANPPKEVSIAEQMTSNYFRNFSVDFLFLKGDAGMPGQFVTRHSVKHFGELYFFEFPLILVGLFFVFRHQRKSRAFVIFILWLLLFPIGSVVSLDESPQATRSIIGVVPLTILAAVGLWSLSDLWKWKLRHFYFFYPLICIIIIFASFVMYIYTFIVKYPTYSSDYWGWQFGPREIVRYFVAHQASYDEMYMTSAVANAPEIFFNFYAPENCEKCRLGEPETDYDSHRKQIFALTYEYITQHKDFSYVPLKIILYPDGKVAFVIAEVKRI